MRNCLQVCGQCKGTLDCVMTDQCVLLELYTALAPECLVPGRRILRSIKYWPHNLRPELARKEVAGVLQAGV